MKIFLTALFVLLAALGFSQNQNRVDEIWTDVQNRIDQQVNYSFDDGEFPFVISMLRVSYADTPFDYDVATNLGWMLENTEQWDLAEDHYKSFRNARPKNPEACYPLGFFYYMRKRYVEACSILEATTENAVHANTFRILAKSYERQNKFADAIRVWQLQLKKWPDDGPAKANIDRVKKKMG